MDTAPEFRHGRSKAQTSLTKILRTISSFPPSLTLSREASDSCERITGNGRFEIDLNIRLGPPPGIEEFEPPIAAAAAAADNGDAQLCDNSVVVVEKSDSSVVRDDKRSEDVEEDYENDSETVEEEAKKNKKNEVVNGDGGLGLLIEAMELVSGGFEDNEPKKQISNKVEADESESAHDAPPANPNNLWTVPAELYGDFEDLSPVVRSKRGRNQVLPYKYRDSFLEPLKPMPRHRSTAVSSKRRSR